MTLGVGVLVAVIVGVGVAVLFGVGDEEGVADGVGVFVAAGATFAPMQYNRLGRLQFSFVPNCIHEPVAISARPIIGFDTTVVEVQSLQKSPFEEEARKPDALVPVTIGSKVELPAGREVRAYITGFRRVPLQSSARLLATSSRFTL